MKKLYAIRNKKTGELLDRWNSFENNAKIAKAGLADSGSYEIVTLRIEPTEPCERCEFYDHLPLCPWCGRSFRGGEMKELTEQDLLPCKTRKRIYLVGPTPLDRTKDRFLLASASYCIASQTHMIPVHTGWIQPGLNHLAYQELVTDLLSLCDLICVLPGWENAESTKFALKVAKDAGIPAIDLDHVRLVCERQRMSGRKENRKKILDQVSPLAQALDLALLDALYVHENGRNILRLIIDKRGGVGFEDCERLSQVADPLISEEMGLDDFDVFEVSSPGFDRPLTSLEDCLRHEGKWARISLYRADFGAHFCPNCGRSLK